MLRVAGAFIRRLVGCVKLSHKALYIDPLQNLEATIVMCWQLRR